MSFPIQSGRDPRRPGLGPEDGEDGRRQQGRGGVDGEGELRHHKVLSSIKAGWANAPHLRIPVPSHEELNLVKVE